MTKDKHHSINVKRPQKMQHNQPNQENKQWNCNNSRCISILKAIAVVIVIIVAPILPEGWPKNHIILRQAIVNEHNKTINSIPIDPVCTESTQCYVCDESLYDMSLSHARYLHLRDRIIYKIPLMLLLAFIIYYKKDIIFCTISILLFFLLTKYTATITIATSVLIISYAIQKDRKLTFCYIMTLCFAYFIITFALEFSQKYHGIDFPSTNESEILARKQYSDCMKVCGNTKGQTSQYKCKKATKDAT